MADESKIPDAAWHDWHGERWAVSTCAMFREGMPVIELPLDGLARWFNSTDRPATSEELDKAVAVRPATLGRSKPNPLVRPNFAPAFAASARVVVSGPLAPIRLFDAEGKLCGVVMPVRPPDDGYGCVRLSTLCAYEVDRG